MNEWIKNETVQLKWLESAFFRRRSMKKMIFFTEKKKQNDGKDRGKFVYNGKLVQFPNYVQLNLTCFIFNEKRALSVG